MPDLVYPDVVALRAARGPEGVLGSVVVVRVEQHDGVLAFVPPSGWPALTSFRSRRDGAGCVCELAFAALVPVADVVVELGRQAVWRERVRVAGPAGSPSDRLDERVLNPAGFLVDAPEPVVDLESLDLRAGVTPALVSSLRSLAGVRVPDGADLEPSAATRALMLAGVPVVGPGRPDVDLADPLAREEHSLVQRRAAFDAWSLAATRPAPSVSVLLATRRPDMLDHALAQVARQRGVADLELVLAPHGFDVDPGRVRDAVPGREVTVVPQDGDVLFGDVLHAASRAARGDVLLKLDDDDWYAPDVVADLLRARAYSGAELVGMPADRIHLTEQDLTIRRGTTTEHYATWVAGGTMLVHRQALREAGGFRSVRRFVDAQLLEGLLAAGAAVYRTHGLGYVLRRNATGHTWQVDLDYLLDPARTAATYPGFVASRLMEL